MFTFSCQTGHLQKLEMLQPAIICLPFALELLFNSFADQKGKNFRLCQKGKRTCMTACISTCLLAGSLCDVQHPYPYIFVYALVGSLSFGKVPFFRKSLKKESSYQKTWETLGEA